MTWWALEVSPGPADRDTVAAWLVTSTGHAVEDPDGGPLRGYAPDAATADAVGVALRTQFGAAVVTQVRSLEPVDWCTRWREGLGVRQIGRLVLCPSWLPPPRGPTWWYASTRKWPSAAASMARPAARSGCLKPWCSRARACSTSARAVAFWPSPR
jgi:hypothetical protein